MFFLNLDNMKKLLLACLFLLIALPIAAAELVMGKALKCPAVIIRDYSFNFGDHGISELIRPETEDLFKTFLTNPLPPLGIIKSI